MDRSKYVKDRSVKCKVGRVNVSRRVARSTSASHNGTPRSKTIDENDRMILRYEEEEEEEEGEREREREGKRERKRERERERERVRDRNCSDLRETE